MTVSRTTAQDRPDGERRRENDAEEFAKKVETARTKGPSEPALSGGVRAVVRDKEHVRDAGGKATLLKVEAGAGKGSGTSVSVKTTEEVREARVGLGTRLDVETGTRSDGAVGVLSGALSALGVERADLECSIGAKSSSGISETKWENGGAPKHKTASSELALDVKCSVGAKTDLFDAGGELFKVEWKPAKGSVEVWTGAKTSSDMSRFRPATGTAGEASADGESEVSVSVAGSHIRAAGLQALAPNAVDPLTGEVDRASMRAQATGNLATAFVDTVASAPLGAVEAFLRAGEGIATATEGAAEWTTSRIASLVPGRTPDEHRAAAVGPAPMATGDMFGTAADVVGGVNRGVRDAVYDALTWQMDAAQYAMAADDSGRTPQQRVDAELEAEFAPRVAAFAARVEGLDEATLQADDTLRSERDALVGEIATARFALMRTIDNGEYARLADRIAPPGADRIEEPVLATLPTEPWTQISQGFASVPDGTGQLEVVWDARTGEYAVHGRNGARYELPGIADRESALERAREFLVHDAVSEPNRLPG